MIKNCKRCAREYDDYEGPMTPAEELGQICLESIGDEHADQLCPDCKEEVGILNLLIFGE